MVSFRKCLLVIALPLLFVLAAESGDAPPPALSVGEIVAKLTARNAERAARLRSYHGTRLYAVDYRGFPGDRSASMVVNVSYEAPQKTFTIVSEEGSKLLLKRVLRKLVESEQEADQARRDTALTESNYRFKLLGTETVDGRRCYLLDVDPKRKDKFLYDGKIWVDAEDFAVVRIEARPAKNPSFWISRTSIEHHYQKLGEFWLPASNRSTTKVRLGGVAVLTISYRDYRIGDLE
jgi:outer membrane lipoprotein-sorting protein